MNNENNFETFLLISNKEFLIFVKDKINNKKLFDNKLVFEETKNEKYLELLNKFLDDNIFKIEKILKSFVNNINLIIDNKEDLKIGISFKKKNYDNLLGKDDLNHLLNDSKNQIKANYDNWFIAHMIITQYTINDKEYDYLPTNIKSEHICLDIYFICFSREYLKKFEKILNRYHIKIKQFTSANYVRNCFKKEKINIFSMCEKIIDGYNENEIFLVPKDKKNKGFFERFFNFFS